MSQHFRGQIPQHWSFAPLKVSFHSLSLFVQLCLAFCPHSMYKLILQTITLKMADQVEVWLLCRFYQEPLRAWIETNVNKFAISNHTDLKLDVHALRGSLRLICNLVKATWRTDYPWSAIVIVLTSYFAVKTYLFRFQGKYRWSIFERFETIVISISNFSDRRRI